MKISQVYMTIK